MPEGLDPSVSRQVLIQGLQNLNRAVHQDVVALQLFPQSQWVAPSSVLLQDEGEAKEDNADEEEQKVVNLCFIFNDIGSSRWNANSSSSWVPSWLNQLRVSVSEQLQPSTAAQKPTGKVVGIIKRNWRPFCGMLTVSQIKEVRVTC